MKHIGLTSLEVQALRVEFGHNVLPAEKKASGLRILLSQFANPLVYILLFVGGISLFLREFRDAFFILLVVVVNSVFGFVQEYKTQKTLTALKRMVKPRAKVIRNGERQEIDAADLVPGDIVFLTVGDRFPADGVVVEAASFFADEAVLTGESESVEKRAQDEVFMGTTVAWGTGVMKVVHIGSATKIGEIAEALKETEQPPTTLQLRLRGLTRTLISIALSLCAVLFVFEWFTSRDFWETLRISSILLVAMLPEALLMAVTIILVIAMQKTLKRKALIRKLLAVETLGSVTTICTDKTGTLTEGKMRVVKTDLADRQGALSALCLCNNLSNATEIALWNFLREQKDIDAQQEYDRQPRIFEIPFSSDHKFMATINCPAEADQCRLYVKGAPETVAAMCGLSEDEKEAVRLKIDCWGKEGLRLIGTAYRSVDKASSWKLDTKTVPTLKWAGLIGLWDPPRKEAKEALATARQAGIKIKVITGDFRHTAEKIVESLGLEIGHDGVLEGQDMDQLTDEELGRRVQRTVLFSRVTPRQKLRIVIALQALGEVVTMTGDGVNDAPALKRANIGIVVGDASEVAKEAADMILLDSNFKTIVAAVEEGRTVFENIRKVIFYMLANSFAGILLTLGSIVLGWPLPLTVIQILWIHLICDGPQDILLGLEPKEAAVMTEGPKRLDDPILDKLRLGLIFGISVLSASLALLQFWYFGLYRGDVELGRTMAFMTVSMGSILYVIPSRSFRQPFWRYENLWGNPWLLAVMVANFLVQAAVSYLPLTRDFLRLEPLRPGHWLLLMCVIASVIMFIECVKWRQSRYRREQRRPAAAGA
jgi:Ca2+-transporting ATPase